MDKPVVIIFVFAAIVLISLGIFLLVVGSGGAKGRTSIQHTRKDVRSRYRTTRRGLDRQIYPPPLRRDRRP
jgi:hypothetical protein